MTISNELIDRFFSANCTEEEKNQVMDYFKANPEKLDQFLTEKGWNSFNPNIEQRVPTEKMLHHITSNIEPVPVIRMWRRWMAAASIILLAGIISLIYLTTKDRQIIKEHAAIAKAEDKKEEKNSSLQTIANKSSKTKTYSLPDKSKVELSGNSSIAFNNPYINGRRDIFLNGEAVFTVVKDKTKPFIVHSKGITTTALGTVFSVSDKNAAFTSVQLYKGSIVIKKENGSHGKPFKDIYLVPGQKIVLNNENFSVLIKTIDTEVASAKLKTEAPKTHQPKIIKFANEPLSEIFAALQTEYAVNISFDVNIIQNMNFTGALNKDKESLESFLNTLCTLNDLILIKQNNSFSISQIK